MLGRINAGGGGSFATSNDAVLVVYAPSGSVVTITKGGITKTASGWTDTGSENNTAYMFAIKAAQFDSETAWTIAASLGSQSSTGTITIDSNSVYYYTLSYRLPAAYQEVDYLESDGSPALTTGISAANIGSIYIKGYMVDPVNYMSLFGACTKGVVDQALETGNSVAYLPKSGRFYVGTAAEGDNYISATAIPANTNFEVAATIASNQYSISVTKNGTTTTTSSALGSLGTITSKNLWLFACNYNGTNAGGVAVRISEVQIYSKDATPVLLANYIPCYRRSDSALGFYNTAEGYEGFKAGTGTFTYGHEV